MQTSKTFFATTSNNCKSNDCTRCIRVHGHCPAETESSEPSEVEEAA